MAIMDLFRPKWQNSNKKKRREAIEAGLEAEILSRIAIADPDESLRDFAFSKLNNANTLRPDIMAIIILQSNSQIREDIIRGITNSEILKCLNEYNTDQQVRETVFAQIAIYATEYGEVWEKELRSTAHESITDSKAISYVVQHPQYHSHDGIGLLVGKIKDTSIIKALSVSLGSTKAWCE